MQFTEKIGTLTKISSTQVQLVGSSVIKLNGRASVLTSPTLLTNVSGLGGIDTGVVAINSTYYVYAVANGATQGIIASLSAELPFGFASYRKVGAFTTNSSSQIIRSYYLGEIPQEEYENYHAQLNFGASATLSSFSVIENTTANWMNAPTISAGNLVLSIKKPLVLSLSTTRGDFNNDSYIIVYKNGSIYENSRAFVNGNITLVAGGNMELILPLATDTVTIDYQGTSALVGYIHLSSRATVLLNWK